MIKSMTGYGREKTAVGGKDILFEIKSVNNRYTDVNIKLPRLFSSLEDKIKQLIPQYISRGKIDIFLSVDFIDGETVDITLNREYLESYIKALSEIKRDYPVNGDITLSLLSSKNEIFITRKADADMEELWSCILPVARAALESFTAMRETEGKRLAEDIVLHLNTLKEIAAHIREIAPKSVAASNEKMIARIKELLDGATPDEGRLLTECAVFADKADICEELVRLNSHFIQFEQILKENAPVGRKLDFLVQELNREINTIGSKGNDLEITRAVIEAKSEIEKIREQIQNLE